jgi:hypothetical protein
MDGLGTAVGFDGEGVTVGVDVDIEGVGVPEVQAVDGMPVVGEVEVLSPVQSSSALNGKLWISPAFA